LEQNRVPLEIHTADKVDEPDEGCVPDPIASWNRAAAESLLAELREEVARVKKKFLGNLPSARANVLADAVDIAVGFVRNHEQEADNGWDSMELVRMVIRRVRRYAEIWPGMHNDAN
jgi:hypothetical protein